MLLKIGSTGDLVKRVQQIVGVTADGSFGPKTAEAVKKWQSTNGLTADGLVGRGTLGKMGLLDSGTSTSNTSSNLYTKKSYTTSNGLEIVEYFMPEDEYKKGPIKAEWLFLHHTAGWHNPYNVIKQWDADKNGPISTEFVMGGPSVRGNDTQYDGELVQAFPAGNWGFHLGKNGSQKMHINSIGIEVCNFGYVKDGKTYAGAAVDTNQIVTLAKPFRGHSTWHRYSDKQIENLKLWMEFIAERDGIDIRAGLPALVKQKGADAFEFNEDAYFGKIKGVWTHTNTRKDKFDMFPQQELLDMLVSL
jgi:peptidoglycan hydrolase-like protein with peptidoglycan-binding domain